jgi:hypothetical protein
VLTLMLLVVLVVLLQLPLLLASSGAGCSGLPDANADAVDMRIGETSSLLVVLLALSTPW